MDFTRFSMDFTRVSIVFRSIWMDFATDQWMSVHFYGWQMRPMNCIRLDSAMAKTGTNGGLGWIPSLLDVRWWENLWDIDLMDFSMVLFGFDGSHLTSGTSVPQLVWAIFLTGSQAVAVSCGQNTHATMIWLNYSRGNNASEFLRHFDRVYPLVNVHITGKSPFFMGTSTINGHVQ